VTGEADGEADNKADGTTADSQWDTRARHETPTERLDRNWTDLLQELRVVQTGVQFLTGFLLTLPFQSRFAQLSTTQEFIYLATVAAAVLATVLLIAPVSLHRILFRHHARAVTVALAHRFSAVGISLLGVAIVGVVLLTFDVVSGRTAAAISAGVTVLLLVAFWLVLPLYVRHHSDDERDNPAQSEADGRDSGS
jgi:hypothetical protein